MKKKLISLSLMILMILTACTPNMQAYLAEAEKISQWKGQRAEYTLDMSINMKDEDKTVNVKIPGKMTVLSQGEEKASMEYSFDLSNFIAELKKDGEDTEGIPEKLEFNVLADETKAYIPMSFFKQLGDNLPDALKDVKEEYIAIDMADSAEGLNPKAVKYLQSPEFTADLLGLKDSILKDYKPVVDLKVEGSTFTYDATAEQLGEEIVNICKALRANRDQVAASVKTIAEKADSTEEVNESLKEFTDLLAEMKEEEVKASVDEIVSALKGSTIHSSITFKENSYDQEIGYNIKIAELGEINVKAKGTAVKDDSVKVEIPTSAKNVTFQEYMAIFMPKLEGINVNLDGEPVEFDVAPVIENSRTLVPFRALLEKLGSEVKWDEAARTITAKKADKEIILTIGSDIAKVDGKEVKLDVAPKLVENRTLVPLRFLSESLGFEVEYNQLGDGALISIISPEFKAELEKIAGEAPEKTEKADKTKETEKAAEKTTEKTEKVTEKTAK